MRRIIFLFELLLMVLTVLLPVSRAEDASFQDLVITSDTVVKLRKYTDGFSEGFFVSPTAEVVGVVKSHGYWRYPSIREDWITTGYSTDFYDLKTGERLRTTSSSDNSELPAVSYTQDGKYAYFVGKQSLEAFDLVTRQQATVFKLKEGSVEPGSLSPDGSKYCYTIPSGADKGLWVYVLSTKQHLKVSGSNGQRPQWSGDGDKIIFASGYLDKELWKIDSTLNEQKLPLSASEKYRLDGNYVMAIPHEYDKQGTLEIYNLATGVQKSFDLSSQGIDAIKDFALYGKDYIIFSGSKEGSDEGGLYLLSIASGSVKRLVKVNHYSFLPDTELPSLQVIGSKVFVVYEGELHLLELGTAPPQIVKFKPASSKVTIDNGLIVKFYAPRINPFTLKVAGPDLEKYKGSAEVTAFDGTSYEAKVVYTTDLQIANEDLVVDADGNVVGKVLK